MSSEPVRIVLDAMGGDRAPHATVRGAVRALEADATLTVVLVGSSPAIEAELELARSELGAAAATAAQRTEILHCTQDIGGGESPVEGLRAKPDASIKRAAEAVRDGRGVGLVAAGNTGAAVAAGTLILKLIPGVKRPGIAVPMPTRDGGHTVLCDAGANIFCKPLHLYHYGVLGARYAQRMYDRAKPTVGLLNVGSEEGKGTELIRETAALFASGDVHFIGNVEGNDVFRGVCDVIVCEGFVGNVVLKTAEGLFETLWSRLAEVLAERGTSGPSDGLLATLGRRLDWAEQGGAPLLGVNGLVLISHGRSDDRAIRNALLQAARLARGRVIEEMKKDIQVLGTGSRT